MYREPMTLQHCECAVVTENKIIYYYTHPGGLFRAFQIVSATSEKD